MTLSQPQSEILGYLQEESAPLTIADIAAQMDLETGAVEAALDALYEAGRAERRAAEPAGEAVDEAVAA